MHYKPSTNKKDFDVIVIGVGSMGSSTCYHLARRGFQVLGLERFGIGHENGAHTGQSRIIRKAYFEAPDYVPLLNSAYKNWNDLESETGEKLYYRTGLLYVGKPEQVLMKGLLQSASLYDIPLETISAVEMQKRFPMFQLPPGFETVLEPDAGFIPPEKAIRLYAAEAKRAGAEIHTKENVMKWEVNEAGCTVTTGKHVYHCKKLILTAGPWTSKMIPAIENKISITRQVIAWASMKDPKPFQLGNLPCWMIADEKKPGVYYGFPILPVDTFGEPGGMKLAHHHPGERTDPDQVRRQAGLEDEQEIDFALNKYFPGQRQVISSTKTCLYTNTPDEHFILDLLPGYDQRVVVGCGFSGHGFKFVSVIGEILADLATKGTTHHPSEFLKFSRFQKNSNVEA